MKNSTFEIRKTKYSSKTITNMKPELNEDQNEAQKLLNSMAICIDSNINSIELSRFVSEVLGSLRKCNDEEYQSVENYLFHITFCLLPDLIKYNERGKSIENLERLINHFFNCVDIESLSNIGVLYFREFAKSRSNDELVQSFMKTLSGLMQISEIFEHYKIYREDKKIAA